MYANLKWCSFFVCKEAAWISFTIKNRKITLHVKNSPPLFSERYGYVKSYKLAGKWRLLVRSIEDDLNKSVDGGKEDERKHSNLR